jgi:hypothetical protein
MGLFGRSESGDTRERRRPKKRRIPDLNPTYFEEVHRSIEAYGGTDTVADIADGVANAIENVAHQLFAGWNEDWAAKSFDKTFGGRERGRLENADEMLDWMVEHEVTSQDVFETTLTRLKEVLTKPPTSA